MKMILIACLCVVTVACGGSPTAPTSAPEAKTVAVVSPEPPAPAPEPIPEPVPQPVPTPVRQVYQAETGFAHWYTELVPNRFEVEIFADHVQFGPLEVPITSQDRDTVLCVIRNEVTVSLSRYHGEVWDWTVNGLAGQAEGRMSR